MSEPVRSFFVTLKRSHIGKPWFHRRVLESLGLKKRLQCVERPNNASTRGRLMQVAHLINIETDQMYYNRKLQELQAAQLRPPMVAVHNSSRQQFPLTALEEANSMKASEQR